MNVEMLKRVRERIAKVRGDKKFDMGTWLATDERVFGVFNVEEFRDLHGKMPHGACGTTACLAGWTVLENADEVCKMRKSTTISGAARKLLGISRADADYLFLGRWAKDPNDLEAITKREALAYLDECIAAGEIVKRPRA